MDKNTKIAATQFGELQGFNNLNLQTLKKVFGNSENTFDGWCKLTKQKFSLKHPNFVSLVGTDAKPTKSTKKPKKLQEDKNIDSEEE